MLETHTSASPCGAKELKAEISWDLAMSEDMPFAEGFYSLDGGQWQVVVALKESEHRPIVGIREVSWDSGVTGINIIVPADTRINSTFLLKIISEAFGVSEWREARGPDSIVLR